MCYCEVIISDKLARMIEVITVMLFIALFFNWLELRNIEAETNQVKQELAIKTLTNNTALYLFGCAALALFGVVTFLLS